MEHLDKQLKAKVVDKDIDHGNDEVSYDLGPASQGGAGETDVTRHPKTSKEGDGEFENKGSNMRCEGDETQIDHLPMEDKMIEHIIEHPFQSQI